MLLKPSFGARLVSALGRHFYGQLPRFEARYTMTTYQILHALGVSAGVSIVYGFKCSSAARKERRQAPGYAPRSELHYRVAHRLGQLWARRQKRGHRALS
jgi:hypothetical protein